MQYMIGALIVLLVLVTAVTSHRADRGAFYHGQASRNAPGVSFRVSSSGNSVTAVELTGRLPGTCRGLSVPGGRTARITHGANFELTLPLRSQGTPVGRLLVTGVFGRSGHETGEMQVLPGHGLSGRCEAVAGYSTSTAAG